MMIFLQKIIDGARANNLTIVIMEALHNSGGLNFATIVERLLCFGVGGVNKFQGIKIGVIKQINTNYAPFSIGVHCMAHR
jgi:hypothetical protein